MSNNAKRIVASSANNSVAVSWLWRMIFLSYGRIPRHPTESENGWYGFCWRTSRSSGTVRSRPMFGSKVV